MSSQRQRLLNEAQWAIERRQFDRAVRVYRQLFEAEPSSIQIGLKLGELYLKSERPEEAVSVYWSLVHSEPTQQNQAQLRTLLSLILRLKPQQLEAQLRLLELDAKALRDEGTPQPSPEALTRSLEGLLPLISPLSIEERLSALERVLCLSLDRLLPSAHQELSQCRLLFAEGCELLQRHQEGLPYYVWLTLEGDRSQVERFGRLAISLDEALDPSLRRHLRLSIARALISQVPISVEQVEQVYFALEPLTQGEVEDDLEAQLLLAYLLRIQGHMAHAKSLLYEIGAKAAELERRSIAIAAYEAILSEDPEERAAREALGELNSLVALLAEAQRAFDQGQFDHTFEYLRTLIDRGDSSLALYELLIATADSLEIEPLQTSSRVTLLDWALQHQIELATQPAVELCQMQASSVLAYLQLHTWLHLSVQSQLKGEALRWLERQLSSPLGEQAPLEGDEGVTLSEVDAAPSAELSDQVAEVYPLLNELSARGRAQALWRGDAPLGHERFTPAPIASSYQMNEPLGSSSAEPSAAQRAPDPAPDPTPDPLPTPLISLPPLISELSPRSTVSSLDSMRPEAPPSHAQPKLTPTSSKALDLYLNASVTQPNELSSSLFKSALAEPPAPQDDAAFAKGLNPLSLFDSGSSFQGALRADHPLAKSAIDALFADELELSVSVDEQLALIEMPSPELMSSGEALSPPQGALSSGKLSPSKPQEDIINEMLSMHEELLHELSTESRRPTSAERRLHIGTHSQLPSLTERLTQIKGRPPNQAQLGVIGLIEAQEYELASVHIPAHLKTASIHYLKALCLYGQGHLDEALELVEITLSRANPRAPVYFYALAAELSQVLRRDESTERYLIELLTLDPELGAVLYQVYRSE